MFRVPSLKSRVRSLLVETSLRRLSAPLHRELIGLELAAARLRDGLGLGGQAADDPAFRRVTAIVKTFERPVQLQRLLASLRRLFPTVPVIVADDSRVPEQLAGVRMLALPFDVGVSAGRQAALAEVRTEFAWVLDDDFVLYRRTRLARVLATLDEQPQLDIVGGPVVNLPLGIKQTGALSPIYPTRATPILPLGSQMGGAVVRDKVLNFFVGRSERLRLVGWDPALKRLDHADFFTRARGVLVTAYDDEFRCLHAQTPFAVEYMRQRMDLDADAAVLQERYFRQA
jgi:hypothetical protein